MNSERYATDSSFILDMLGTKADKEELKTISDRKTNKEDTLT